MSTPILKLEGVRFSYSGHEALSDISFTVHKGDFIGLIGPNGSGKTTLLKIILGLLTPQHGSVHIFEKKIESFRDWHKVGYVPQKIAQVDTQFPVTAEEVVLQGRVAKVGMFRRFRREDRAIADQALSSVGMLQERERLLRDLSGGQQQRVYIARALASQPEVLILDEPTVGVDASSEDEFYNLLSNLKKEHDLTIMMVSHDVEVLAKEVNRLLCLNKTIVYHGNPERFVEGDFIERLYGQSKRFIHHSH